MNSPENMNLSPEDLPADDMDGLDGSEPVEEADPVAKVNESEEGEEQVGSDVADGESGPADGESGASDEAVPSRDSRVNLILAIVLAVLSIGLVVAIVFLINPANKKVDSQDVSQGITEIKLGEGEQENSAAVSLEKDFTEVFTGGNCTDIYSGLTPPKDVALSTVTTPEGGLSVIRAYVFDDHDGAKALYQAANKFWEDSENCVGEDIHADSAESGQVEEADFASYNYENSGAESGAVRSVLIHATYKNVFFDINVVNDGAEVNAEQIVKNAVAAVK